MIRHVAAGLFVFCMSVFSGHETRAYGKADYDQYVADFAAATATYSKVVQEYRALEQRYASATADAVGCKIGIWASLFKQPVADMESERQKLEAIRKEIWTLRDQIETDRESIQRQENQLNLEGAGSPQYWVELEQITNRMRTKYVDKLQDRIIVGLRHYIGGIKGALRFLQFYQTECQETVPGRTIVRVAIENATTIVQEVADFVKAARSLFATLPH